MITTAITIKGNFFLDSTRSWSLNNLRSRSDGDYRMKVERCLPFGDAGMEFKVRSLQRTPSPVPSIQT